MSKTPNYDAKIKTILEALRPGEKVCPISGEKWQMPEKEIEYYKKFNVPPHEVSPNTLWKQMAYYDCAYQFWWNKHFETGQPVLSFHHPASGIRVLPDAEWHAKDFSETFEELDLSKPFFGQLRNLELRVPLLANFNRVEPENSITLFSFGDRDSYFTFACKSERSFFSGGAFGIEDSSLVWLCGSIINSHHVAHSQRLHGCRYCVHAVDCLDSTFLFDCRGCKNCFGATNRRQGQYVFMNQQLTKGEFEKKVSEIDLSKRSELEKWQKEFDNLLMTEGVWPENFNIGSEDSVGDYLNGAVRCFECFDNGDSPVDCWRSAWMYGNNNGGIYSWGMVDNTDIYMCVSSPNTSKSKFCYRSFRLDNCEYCLMSSDCRDCFGCVGLKNKRFCILNKQYSEEEYWKTLDDLKCAMLENGEYGKYLPPELSSTYVPEGGATIYCGATDEEIKKIGGLVFDPNADGATGTDRLKTEPRKLSDIPDSIDDLGDDWVGAPIYDEKAKRTFSFLKPEIEYYRTKRIAPPAEHFIRRLNEVAMSGQQCSFENKSCHQCQKDLLVSKCLRYPERKVYCNGCYLKYLEENN